MAEAGAAQDHPATNKSCILNYRALPFPRRLLHSIVMNNLLLIAAGGATGSIARHLLSTWIKSWSPGTVFPWGIFIVNVSGCFLFGMLHGWCQQRGDAWRLMVLTGLLGGYTTFSTFGWDTADLLQRGHTGTALLNALASVAAGVLAVWCGMALSARASL
jgi:fluoride exporter